MTAAGSRRTLAQARALRRYAMTCAWDQAYHIVSIYPAGTRKVHLEARRLLAWGWKQAKLAELHGYLPPEEAPAAPVAPVVTVQSLRVQIEDLENRDRLGVDGLQRLGSLRTSLLQAEKLAA